MKATKIKDDTGKGSGSQALWSLDETFVYGDEGGKTNHVITSAVVLPFSGPETYVFPSDNQGNVLDWGELPGSYRGGMSHDAAIKGFLEAERE